MEETRVKDLESLKATWINHKADIDTMCFEQDSKLKKVEVFEVLQNTHITQLDNMEKKIHWHVEQTEATLNKSMKEFGDRLTSL